ncbi:hypothetical protein [Levilactobacillus wangkuiensis]|uniref:hypothetical protein n=1 Tax=Levilactobacillus wangkuiensis TaxID=2799566 RepID=UPI0019422260|nr:hypothetical protein [Levilactobacillus wangkuiensis]
MFKEKWQHRSQVQRPSCRWIYAGVTLVSLGAGVMLVTTPVFADTRETATGDGTPQTENVTATQTTSSVTPADVSQSGQTGTGLPGLVPLRKVMGRQTRR